MLMVLSKWFVGSSPFIGCYIHTLQHAVCKWGFFLKPDISILISLSLCPLLSTPPPRALLITVRLLRSWAHRSNHLFLRSTSVQTYWSNPEVWLWGRSRLIIIYTFGNMLPQKCKLQFLIWPKKCNLLFWGIIREILCFEPETCYFHF